MKTIVLTLAVLLGVITASQADVFIYKNKIKYTSTGGGGTAKYSVGGWTVINDIGEVTQVLAFTAQKKFAIVPMQSIEFNVVDAGLGKQHTFFIQRDIWTDSDGHTHIDTGGARGANFDTTVDGTVWSIPKTFTWGGRSMYPASSAGDLKFEESAGTFTFDKKWTDLSNAAGDDINAAAQRLAEDLIQKGYVDFSALP
jgi:hypothetical protein